jgi:hypothetical protein
MAEGGESASILAWIEAHDGRPETLQAAAAGRGLHSPRLSDTGGAGNSAPRRYVLPPGALAPHTP